MNEWKASGLFIQIRNNIHIYIYMYIYIYMQLININGGKNVKKQALIQRDPLLWNSKERRF